MSDMSSTTFSPVLTRLIADAEASQLNTVTVTFNQIKIANPFRTVTIHADAQGRFSRCDRSDQDTMSQSVRACRFAAGLDF